MNIGAIKELLAKYPEPKDRGEDFNPCDWSGGNFDDAYELGREDGEQELASVLRKMIA